MAAPLNNSNALKHGITAGKLPPGASYVKRITDRLRCTLEDETLDCHGEVTLTDLMAINSAIRWERHALLSQLWLRKEGENLTPEQRVMFSREVARASSERDKCIRSLDIGRGSTSPSLYRAPGGQTLAELVFRPARPEQAPDAAPGAPGASGEGGQ